MLDLMRSDITADAAESSTEAVARALATLTPSDLLRALDGSRRWPEGVPLLTFIAGIMRSLVDGRVDQRRRLVEHALAGSEIPPAAPPDMQLHARQCLAAIAQFFAADTDVLTLIAALARQYLGGPNNAAPRLSQKRREAARKRLARAILRGQLDGFLP